MAALKEMTETVVFFVAKSSNEGCTSGKFSVNLGIMVSHQSHPSQYSHTFLLCSCLLLLLSSWRCNCCHFRCSEPIPPRIQRGCIWLLVGFTRTAEDFWRVFFLCWVFGPVSWVTLAFIETSCWGEIELSVGWWLCRDSDGLKSCGFAQCPCLQQCCWSAC